MKFLKDLFSFTMPLFIVLSILSLYLSINQVVENYKYKINNDYAIMVVSSTPLVLNKIKSLSTIKVKEIEILQRDEIINKLKAKLSTTSLELLKQKLPYFYNIYLDSYPTSSQLKEIRTQLMSMQSIKRIETFSSNHNQVYSLLVLIEKVVSILFVFFAILSVLLLSKQVKIWFFEHSKRITIIEYHGGSIYYSTMPMIKLAVYSSIISTILVIVISVYISNNLPLFINSEILDIISGIKININYVYITATSFIVSAISVAGVMIKHKIK